MRAVVLHGPGDVRVEEVPEPDAGPGEIVLAVEVALTCATDAKMARNGAHPALGSLPVALGHEVVGQVVRLGDGVDPALLGSRVVAANSAPCGECADCGVGARCWTPVYMTGAFAERLRVPAAIVARNVLQVPDGVPGERAALVEPLACAIRGAQTCGAGPGDRVLVVGGGVQGALITAMLARRGCRVVVSDPHEARRARAMLLGAERAIGGIRSQVDVADVRDDLTHGRGLSFVIEAVGRPQSWEVAAALAGAGGEVTLYGGCAPGTAFTIDAGRLHYQELRLQGSYHHTPQTVREALDVLVSDERFTSLLEAAIGLEDVPQVLLGTGARHPVDCS